MVAFTSCDLVNFSANESDYVPATPETGAQVYFYNTNATSVSLDGSATSFDILVGRQNTDEAINVPIKVTGNEEMLLSIPASVSFAAGQAEAALPVSYDLKTLGYDHQVSFTVALASEMQTTSYGLSELSMTAVIPAPWTSLGTGTITENWWALGSSAVEIFQNDIDPNQFKLVNPFNRTNSNTVITLLQPGDVLSGVTVTMSGLVNFEDFYIDVYSGYGDVYFLHPSRFSSLSAESNWTHSKVLDYQENGLPGRIQLAPYCYIFGVGGWNNINNDGICIIDFPGYAPKDFTFTMSREGTFYDLDEKPYSVAKIGFGTEETTSSDIAYVAAACVLTDDADKALNALLEGEVEPVIVEADGTVNLPMSGESGYYTIIAVAYDENDEAQEYMYETFEYYAPGSSNPWESIGFCKYTDDIVGPWFEADPVTYYVEVLKNTENPGMYRMVHPYGPDYPYNEEGDYDTATHYFEIDATDPDAVWFGDQNLGVDWSYGTMHAYTLYYPGQSTANAGKLAEGKITFPAKSIIVYDDSSWNYANANAAFCLDLNNPLPERPESSEAAPSSVRSSKVSSSAGAKRLHSHKVGFNRNKVNFEQISL